MATIANLVIAMEAVHTKVASGFKKAAAATTSFAGTIAKVGSVAVAAGTALLGLAGAGTLGVLVKNSLEAIDNLGKLSDRLGATTQSLAALQYAGSLAGVSMEQLTGGLQKLLNSIGEAVAGTGTAIDAFNILGLSASKLAQMPTDEAFALVADRLSKVDNAAIRARLAMDIFGKSGQALLPLLLSGKEGLAQMAAEAERFGLSFNRIDAAKVEAANDAFTRVGAILTGIGNQLAIVIAPFLEAVVMKTVEWATATSSVGETFSRIGGFVLTVLGLVANGIQSLGSIWQLVVFGIAKANEVVTESLGSILRGLAKAIDLTGTLARVMTVLTQRSATEAKRWADEAEKALNDALSAEQWSHKLERFIISVQDAAQAEAEALTRTAQQRESIILAIDAEREALEKLKREAERVFEDTRTPLERFEAEIRKLQDLLENELISQDTFDRAVAKAKEELERLTKVAIDTVEAAPGGAAPTSQRLEERRRVLGFDGSSNRVPTVLDKQLEVQKKQEVWMRTQTGLLQSILTVTESNQPEVLSL